MLDEALKRDSSLDVVFLQAQSAWLRGEQQMAREKLRQAWQAATPGNRPALRREWQSLASRHTELPDLLAELA
jgi:hypothetical protein